MFECPGCQMGHLVYPHGCQADSDQRWNWNGDLDSPTFSPSLKVTYPWGEERTERICHSFITAGRIEFLNDCTHSLAGKTVDIPEWED